MLLSLNWLNDHVDLSGITPQEIAHAITMRTALIEGVTDQRAALEGVVVGEVLECGRHPDADRLSVCRVGHGAAEPAHVVCGAPNVAAGQKIIYAPVGLKLPNGLKLKKAKIRGQVSEGMICAEDEIGLGPEHDGILVLDDALEPGAPIGGVPGLADVLFEIENKSITHRPDLWGHYGFARELAAIFGRELKPLELDGDLRVGDHGPAIELEDTEGCPLYAGLCVEGRQQPSPDWLRFRLVACGMRPLGLLVDLSNYVMLEIGQPTHPFDRDTLAGDRIIVRRAAAGERLRTLDDVDRELLEDDLVIADGEQGVALAGVMGSAQAEVGDGTSRIFLESAWFHPGRVRRTSSRLGLRTEALARFEKALDPALAEQAVRRYALLLRRLGHDVEIAPAFRLAGAAAAPERNLALATSEVRGLLGSTATDAEIVATLESVGFGVTAGADGALDVAVPSWRATRDITLKQDLIEEVGRLTGYDAVPTAAPAGPLLVGRRAPLLVVEEQLRDALARDAAFTETVAYSMVADGALADAGWTDTEALPRLANPLQQDAARLRPSPVPGMLARLESWLRRDEDVRTFEIGRGYRLQDGAVTESREAVAFVAHRRAGGPDVVRELKAVAEGALTSLGRPAPELEVAEPTADVPWMHPRRTARVRVADADVGWLGEVSPNVLQRLGVRESPALLEGGAGLLVLDVEALGALPEEPVQYRKILRFPPVRIDLALVVDYGVTTAALRDAILEAGPRTLVAVEPFDVYHGPPLAENERSIAFHLVFQAKDRTLTDDDVAKARERIVKRIQDVGARLR